MPHMQIQFTARPLSEITLSKSEELPEEKLNEINNWCRNTATFIHGECDEYLFWVPPVSNCKKVIETRYGKDTPEIISNILQTYSKLQQDKQDAGYLLIAFI
jgi:hypothetical protein